jgi:hypothetical protein
MNFMEKGDLYEHLAAIEHQRWADWQQYVFDQCRRSDPVHQRHLEKGILPGRHAAQDGAIPP